MDAFLEEIKRSDRSAQSPHSAYSLQCSKGTRQTERLDLLGVVSLQCVLTGSTLTLLPEAHARSATAMAGWFCSYITPEKIFNIFQLTKDRVEVKTGAILRYSNTFVLTSLLTNMCRLPISLSQTFRPMLQSKA